MSKETWSGRPRIQVDISPEVFKIQQQFRHGDRARILGLIIEDYFEQNKDDLDQKMAELMVRVMMKRKGRDGPNAKPV